MNKTAKEIVKDILIELTDKTGFDFSSSALDAFTEAESKLLQEMKTAAMAMVVEEREHRHSIYTHCRACHTWGINMPNDKVCGNCGNKEDTTTYYPDDSFKSARQDQLERFKRFFGEEKS